MGLIKIYILIILILGYSSQAVAAQELIQAPAAIHISSTVSDGKYSIPEIIEIARLNDIKIVVLTDRDLMRWQYGLWPLRNIIKKTVESNSVFKYGIKHYLNDIRDIQEHNPDMVIIPGVESAPFYYWEGSPFDGSLKMCNWHRHILAIGLEKIADYRMLPIAGNPSALRLPFRCKDAFKFWPVLLLIIGFLCMYKRRFKYRDLRGRALGPYSLHWRICGICMIIVGLLFTLNNFPYREFIFDNYKGDLGILPYQNFINYVNKQGGVVFWAHPEAENIQDLGKIKIETKEYSRALLEAENYTGFSIFYDGYNRIGLPGGIWDTLLKEYCQGKRDTPVWAIAGLCFDRNGELTTRLKRLRTVLLVPELNKPEVIQALRKGRMYVSRGEESSQFILDKFFVSDSCLGSYAIMGEEIGLQEQPVIEASGYFLNGEEKALSVRLIRDGEIIKTFHVTTPFDISFHDVYRRDDKIKSYYRLEIRAHGLLVVTNPIFVSYLEQKRIKDRK